MSGAEPPAERRGGGLLRLALWAVIAVGAAAVVYVMVVSSIKPGAGQGLERFARGEPLRRVHECIFAILALESEPVDPRL